MSDGGAESAKILLRRAQACKPLTQTHMRAIGRMIRGKSGVLWVDRLNGAV